MATKQSRSHPKTRSRVTKKTARRSSSKTAANKRWSARVTTQSNALDLESKVFKGTPSEIATSLKRSAERSRRRKSSPYQSAMSMLTFYINRGGKNLSATERRKLQAAKTKLREKFGRAG